MTAFVLYASVAITFFLQSRATSATDDLLEIFWRDGAVVTDFWELEVGNGILKADRREHVAPEVTDFALLMIRVMAERCEIAPRDREGWLRIVRLAIEHRLSTYDAAYLDASIVRRLPLATLGRSLRSACSRSRVAVLPSTMA